MKNCARCGHEKPLSEFRTLKAKGRPDRPDAYCVPCRNLINRESYERNKESRRAANRAHYLANIEARREYNQRYKAEHADAIAAHRRGRVKQTTYQSWERRLRLLGITPADYLSMLAAQNGRCAICGRDEPGKIGTWPVDHDHESGVVRGLLCHRCNQALGLFGDDPEVLSAAIAYLARQRV